MFRSVVDILEVMSMTLTKILFWMILIFVNIFDITKCNRSSNKKTGYILGIKSQSWKSGHFCSSCFNSQLCCIWTVVKSSWPFISVKSASTSSQNLWINLFSRLFSDRWINLFSRLFSDRSESWKTGLSEHQSVAAQVVLKIPKSFCSVKLLLSISEKSEGTFSKKESNIFW